MPPYPATNIPHTICEHVPHTICGHIPHTICGMCVAGRDGMHVEYVNLTENRKP